MRRIVRANMTEEAGDRLSDEELIAQVRSFIFAATDTTSNVLCRILHTLAEHPVAQAKLREEIQTARRAHGTEVPFDTLNDLAYLDAVCRETLRLYDLSMLIATLPINDVYMTVIFRCILPLGSEYSD